MAITPDRAGLDAMHQAFARLWEMKEVSPPVPSPGWRSEFITAMGEIVSNIVRHSLPATPAPGTAISLEFHLTSSALTAVFRNAGAPFTGAIPAAKGATAPADPLSLPEGQFGLPMARRALDSLTYSHTPSGDNIWTLVKRR
jgi:anti-sigma regulatory factor (Ser/Thr protein kinase)